VDQNADKAAQALVNYEFYKPNFTAEEFSRNLEANDGILRTFDRFFVLRYSYVEIGVGLGFLARAAATRFQKIYGLDLEIETASSVGGTPDNVIFLKHEEFDPEVADGISALGAWHVIEHLPRPHEVLGRLLEKIAKGGVFFGQIPLYKETHVFDAHFIWYTETGIVRLLRPYGLHPIYFERDETNDFLSFCFRMR
jgi:2-polyprenyl-3-methyl-5-hydroxy-6-metoxy-1,4-benzoquinol methylase